MRPITKPNNPTVYAEPAQNYQVVMQKYPSATIQQFYAFFATQNWYQLEHLAQPSQQQEQDIKRKKFYVKKLGDYYGDARHDLFESIGEVCSYCGMPIRDDAQVEHVSPKAWFPDQMVLWANFLIACRDCNSRKSSRPSGQPNDTPADFVWPHTDLRGRMISHLLGTYDNTYTYEKARAAPVFVGSINASKLAYWMWEGNIKITIAKGGSREVVLVTTRKTYNIAVMVRSSVDGARALVNEIFKLNTYTDSPEVSDRRMTERTQAWIQAVDAVRNIVTVRSAPIAVRRAVIEQVMDTILATGFWLVWVEVFVVQGGDVLEPEERDLIAEFLRGTRFPGTAAGRLFFD
jgi:5-methylcytosine-specific restriction endonuclease McrA